MLSKITEWANQLGLIVANVEDPMVDFRLVVSEPNLPPIEIVHVKTDSAYVLIAARISIAEEHYKKLLATEPKEIENLLWEVKLKLLFMGVEFRIVRPEEKVPTAWEVHSKLFLEEAIPQHFSDVYMKVKNAALYVAWSYKRVLD